MVRSNQALNPRVLEAVLFTLPILRTLRVPALFELRKLSQDGALLSDTPPRMVKSGAEPVTAAFKWTEHFLGRPLLAVLRRSDAVDRRPGEGCPPRA